MARSITYLFLSLLPLALGACSEQTSAPMPDTGISWELAQTRHRTISDVRYELSFALPAAADSAIAATEAITFGLDSLWAVQLDFREDARLLHAISVNGHEVAISEYAGSGKTAAIVMAEHIVLPQALLQKGENRVEIAFTAGEQSLNRRADYLYTLFVPDRARTVFPCFDQPNLKALFTLSLDLPEGWTAVANSSPVERTGQRLHFATTEPLPTYLFAFAAGRFDYQPYTDPRTGRTIGAYYRETDPQRLAQLPDIFREVCFALDWQEEFTAQPYPFSKYDLVILPGFQFGGMEHTGATFYNDQTLFLPAHPTMQERLARTNLITHETSHMWFGDLVTMQWFDDVWTKEVFANYFAAAITEPLYPEVNHDINWLRTFQASALSEDRTPGSTAIQQPLDNLRDAGLIYNQIIYNKAPLVMRKLVELMGMEAFRRGIRRYVHDFAYANATWDDLVERLDSETPADLRQFSQVWVKERGLPIYAGRWTDGNAEWTEHDPYGRGLHWEQTWRDSVTADGQLLPNVDGRGYGIYTFADTAQLPGLLDVWQQQEGTTRQSLLMTLHENYLLGHLTHSQWQKALIRGLQDTDPLTVGSLVSYLYEPMLCQPDSADELQLLTLATSHELPSARTQLWRLLAARATSAQVISALHDEWLRADNALLSEQDYMTMSYELAVRLPDEARQIISRQRSRLTNADRQRQYDYVSRAVVASQDARDSLFATLISDPQARRIEPWARQALYYLNHPLRQHEALRYIRPALAALPDIQRTGDIFFPGQWCSNLLAAHGSAEAKQEVETFLDEHPDLNPLLRNKILVAASRLH